MDDGAGGGGGVASVRMFLIDFETFLQERIGFGLEEYVLRVILNTICLQK